MEEQQVVRALAALAQSHRLRVFRLLVVAGEDGMTPGALAASLALPAATLSFHLKELSRAGLVTQERISRHLVYRASFGHMQDVLTYLTENCCQGTDCAMDGAASPCAC